MEDKEYMQTAIELARQGIGSVEPNPAVGCIIVKDSEIVGRGRHEHFGGPHAEINALSDCRANGIDPAGATMYVTLEPCRHVGKTAPCSEAVIEAQISKVFVAAGDPSEHVAGGGIEQLKRAGIEVQVGLCRKQARLLNAGFFKHAETRRPWVIAKWAQSADGFLAGKTRRWITNEASRRDVHRQRRRCQGILVGVDTVIADDPVLTVRIEGLNWPRQPLRIVLDGSLRISAGANVLDTQQAPTLMVITSGTLQRQAKRIRSLAAAGVEILAVAHDDKGRCDLGQLLDELGRRGIQQLLAEGGRDVLNSFLQQDLVDEVRVYISPEPLASDGTVRISEAMEQAGDKTHLWYAREQDFDGDRCISGMVGEIG
ncbi:MAG: bifunctional diaminohydroxyphosphoribosylaminopyrimidine deaminase/5-amino-6-(5-phosphoribosylamino)uracil reductase RibD [Planctomycetota bacterium]|nr:MAG: bifunctional diaminohydroxyphosphoribosylaminopyrimidine deaminase/5-amino-6-(5-phosphoribosylamino)uracil reductase RibD [Planctomycetota bacterium]